MASPPSPSLRRELGTFGAIMMGLGSIVGTGVFVSIGVAAGTAGSGTLIAVAIGALVATCNGLSSAQLAANHPVSGGTYEYGYRYLTPTLGFVAGWLFLLAKTASAATAALGFASYALNAIQVPGSAPVVPVALGAIAALTAIVLTGLRYSNRANIAIVGLALLSLGFFVVAGLPLAISGGAERFQPVWGGADRPLPAVLEASALMFVAYTGYGRIATLGEEVREPSRTIPRAIIGAMVVVMVLYLSVAAVGIGAVGAEALEPVAGQAAAPLAVAARRFAVPGSEQILSLGAIAAMLGVLLNLILGLSRVLLAMARKRDMPAPLARLDAARTTPTAATLLVGLAIAVFASSGNVGVTWSFSAFTVLVYYALTNWAALRLSAAERLYPRWISGAGLASCLFLAFWVEQSVWLLGVALIGVGLAWRAIRQQMR
ncbi:MAG: amino acid permease [Cyanobacteria bacterium QS_8_64_29]|nr:MAG: amino acid permease [Cyanobacteria bacterium QS_8_64_29]